MNCPICNNGETEPRGITVTLTRPGKGPGTTIVFRNVPAQVCTNCGEEYVDEATTSRLLKEADDAASAGVEVEVRAFAA